MNQEDVDELDRALRELSNAIFEMQEIKLDSDKPYYTVDLQSYESHQQDAQQAIVDLMQKGDEVADATDEFVAQDGTVINLPRVGLDRDIDNMPVMPE